jgi:hypothetical protein
LAGLCSFTTLCPVWQAEDAVANLPLRLAVRALRPTKFGGVL